MREILHSSKNESESEKGTSTELRLGPPGSECHGSGSKRGFGGGLKPINGSGSGGSDVGTGSSTSMDNKYNNLNSSAASKEQVVGWPPIRSFRKNSMVTNPSKNNKEEKKLEAGCMYVKVSMDGAPYLRKVDLNMYMSYSELSAALEKMFSCFTIGQNGYRGVPNSLHHSSEKGVLTYEDKDGDWMLVGDVPWEMFTNTCRRIRITKGSEAIGLAPSAVGKYKREN